MTREEFLVARDFLNATSPKLDNWAVADNVIGEKEFDVTIIIPCYNEEKYVRQCLDSVLAQKTEYKLRTLIINDGSTDGTAEILAEYAGEPGFCIVNQENRGFSGARNRALETINSRYVLFLDSDDYLVEGTLDGLIKTADEYGADVVEAGMLNLVQGKLLKGENAFDTTGVVDSFELSGYVGGKLVAAELFKDVKFPENYWYEDIIMTFLIYTRCKCAVKYNQDFYVYRRHPEGITATSGGKVKSIDTYWLTELMLCDMEKLGIEMNQTIYGSILNQIALNFVRTDELSENVKVAIFMLTLEWFGKLHEQFSATDRFQAILEKALSVEDYNLYKQACVLLWKNNLFKSL